MPSEKALHGTQRIRRQTHGNGGYGFWTSIRISHTEKLFFRKSGYITKEWYPYFLAVRRGKKELQEEYEEGNVTLMAKRIYDVLSEEKDFRFIC